MSDHWPNHTRILNQMNTQTGVSSKAKKKHLNYLINISIPEVLDFGGHFSDRYEKTIL